MSRSSKSILFNFTFDTMNLKEFLFVFLLTIFTKYATSDDSINVIRGVSLKGIIVIHFIMDNFSGMLHKVFLAFLKSTLPFTLSLFYLVIGSLLVNDYFYGFESTQASYGQSKT